MGRNNGVVELSDRAEASREESEWVEPLDVLNVLGHRYPFLLVDRLRVVEPGRRALGLKRVTAGDWWSEAADSGLWEMPGTLVVEALAQTSAAVLISLVNESPGAVGYFASADRVRFRVAPPRGRHAHPGGRAGVVPARRGSAPRGCVSRRAPRRERRLHDRHPRPRGLTS